MVNHNILKLNGQIMQFDNPNKRYEMKNYIVAYLSENQSIYNNNNMTFLMTNAEKSGNYFG